MLPLRFGVVRSLGDIGLDGHVTVIGVIFGVDGSNLGDNGHAGGIIVQGEGERIAAFAVNNLLAGSFGERVLGVGQCGGGQAQQHDGQQADDQDFPYLVHCISSHSYWSAAPARRKGACRASEYHSGRNGRPWAAIHSAIIQPVYAVANPFQPFYTP